jgi:hypothetical protein
MFVCKCHECGGMFESHDITDICAICEHPEQFEFLDESVYYDALYAEAAQHEADCYE